MNSLVSMHFLPILCYFTHFHCLGLISPCFPQMDSLVSMCSLPTLCHFTHVSLYWLNVPCFRLMVGHISTYAFPSWFVFFFTHFHYIYLIFLRFKLMVTLFPMCFLPTLCYFTLFFTVLSLFSCVSC